ncbi:MAG: universal stress protein [Actinomycetales bacterium]|nr:universal stress protein [Actinomycetales bacterium]
MSEEWSIVVGIDEEPASRLALDWAIDLAHGRPVRLRLVHAVDVLMPESADAERILAEAAHRVEETAPGCPMDTVVADGPIPDALLRHAEGADLLVIGSHRTRRWRSILTGDVPGRMARAERCAVVVVPDDWAPHPGGDVVVGVADDDSSREAIERAAEFAEVDGAALRLVHGWSPILPGDPALPPPVDLETLHRDRLDDALDAVRGGHPDLRVHGALLPGDAAHGLIQASRTPELIVVGSHRHGVLAGALLGSVARRLLRESRTPLCIVPAGPDDAGAALVR